MDSIAEWWPQLHEEIRRALVNSLWSPVALFSREEIARLGGPAPDSAFWEWRDGEAYLPSAAIRWIAQSPDLDRLNEPKEPDPRAAYFRRGWPRRQP